MTYSICELATKYNFSVWEGATKNPYSLCISAIYPSIRQIHGISIKMLSDGNYQMCFTNESNPNNINRKNYDIELGNDKTSILKRLEKEIKNMNSLYGKVEDNHSYYFVINPYWRKR